MQIKIFFYILISCYLATFFRLLINNNLIISIVGSFFVGFIFDKRLSSSSKKIIFSGFFSCFTSFSGFVYFVYKILNQGDWIKFLIFLNLIIIINIFTMYFGFWISRKIT
ncbi:MAG: CrcB family protein [Prochlorococcus marinus CUG1438]|nr:CrcB family protein [Prochlorococcus marinus CUG1438]